jgi:hypothetical protein
VEDIATESSIICVTESHLDTNIIDNDILIDGFSDKILRKDINCFGDSKFSQNAATDPGGL